MDDDPHKNNAYDLQVVILRIVMSSILENISSGYAKRWAYIEVAGADSGLPISGTSLMP